MPNNVGWIPNARKEILIFTYSKTISEIHLENPSQIHVLLKKKAVFFNPIICLAQKF